MALSNYTPSYFNRKQEQSPLINQYLKNATASPNVESAALANKVVSPKNNVSNNAVVPKGTYLRAIGTPENLMSALTKKAKTYSTTKPETGSPRITPYINYNPISETNISSNTSGGASSGSGSSSGNDNTSNSGLQAAQRAAAQNAYNNNLSALESAYAKQLAGLQSNLASTQNLLKSNFNLSKDNLYSDAEKALQEAYINRMMNEKNLQQQLNAQGLNGGATESAIASLLNNYGTSRNNINTTYNSNLAQLEQAYLNNLSQAQQDYNDAVSAAATNNMNYRMQLENDLYKALLG